VKAIEVGFLPFDRASWKMSIYLKIIGIEEIFRDTFEIDIFIVVVFR